tara:strand:+ start:804 stop:1001 length:198 start_codon:yes stop_codon:yes gene_type:complete
MKITNGKWIHECSSWSDKKIKSYLNQGWNLEDLDSNKSQSKKKDITMTVEATVEQPTNLEENDNG